MTSASRPSDRTPVALPEATGTRVSGDGVGTGGRTTWQLAPESPLVLLYDGERFGVMMVTPADLQDFATGFTLTEGIAAGPDDIAEIRLATAGTGHLANVVLREGIGESARERRRSILAGSACGICGAQTLEAAVPRPPVVGGEAPSIEAVARALAALAGAQPMNRATRSMHAAAFADRTGRILLAREDIGRHNALDKLAGALARSGHDPATGFVVLSSRVSVEMVMKSARIGVPLVAAVSAPSDLALAKAGEAGLIVACLAEDDLIVFGGEAA